MRFGRPMVREGGNDCLLKPLQPFFRNIGPFFRMGQLLLELFNRWMAGFRFGSCGPFFCQLLLELFSQQMACFQLFPQNADLLIGFNAFRADPLGQGECIHPDPLRFILDIRHRASRAADHFKRVKVVVRFRRSLTRVGTLPGQDRLRGFGGAARNDRSLGSNNLEPGCGVRRPRTISPARVAFYPDHSRLSPRHPLISRHLVSLSLGLISED